MPSLAQFYPCLLDSLNLRYNKRYFISTGKGSFELNVGKLPATNGLFSQSPIDSCQAVNLLQIGRCPKVPQTSQRRPCMVSNEDEGFPLRISTTPDGMLLDNQCSAFKAVRKVNRGLRDATPVNVSSISCTALCYEILVNSVLKIFHHPNISLLPFNERLHLVVTNWPVMWLFQLGRKSTLTEIRIMVESVADWLLPSLVTSSLIDLIKALQDLLLDQAEFGLVETIYLTRMLSRGKVL